MTIEKTIYLDNAATTPVRGEVMARMLPFFGADFANPAAKYRFATNPWNAIEDSRMKIAALIGATDPTEIYFTSSGTEADNWAIRGVCNANPDKKHIVTTAFEHHAIMETCADMERNGYEVTYVLPNREGRINPDDVKAALRPDTAVVSVMYANNEIGSIQPIAEIGRVCRAAAVPFHTDAVQAVGHIHVDVISDYVDLLSLSAHKFYGPKGVGALYVRKGVKIAPIIFGGMQEGNKRAGTHNVPGIAAIGVAAECAALEIRDEIPCLTKLRDKLQAGILDKIPYTSVNGGNNRLPGNLNVSFRFVESEAILNLLDFKGVYASSGSACNADDLEASHVILALGLTHEEANGTVRFSLGKYTKESDIDFVLDVLPPIIEKLRNMSPLYEDFVGGGSK